MIPLFWFAYCTGLRASELARLKWKHIDLDKGTLYIYKQKNNREQTLPLSSRAQRVVASIQHRDGYVFRSPWPEQGKRSVRRFVEHVSRTFSEGRRLAGVQEKLTLHGLRHGFCTRLAEGGKSAVIIKEAARHASIQTSIGYVEMSNLRLRVELEDAFG